jgi:hypothetical protein
MGTGRLGFVALLWKHHFLAEQASSHILKAFVPLRLLLPKQADGGQ